MEDRKLIERRYYDGKALQTMSALSPATSDVVGAASIPALLRAPYVEFERRVRQRLRPDDVVVDIGAGTGIHSLVASGARRRLFGIDFSFAALSIARRRASAHELRLHVICADGERLPLASGCVDLVTTAGILYCLELGPLVSEIRRVLRPGGSWVLVDSFDHNPVYRLNRFVGYLRGRRTRRALTNIPNRATIARLRQEFRHVDVSYHGTFAFLGPTIRRLVGEIRAEQLIDRLDRASPLFRRFAFKIVATVSEPKDV